jgi:GTP pyrophosphokinase
MNEIAEKGYAAHYKYKQKNKKDIGIESWLDRLQELLKSNSVDAIDFIDDFKLSLYSEEIFVFTPKGDLISLPKGSTGLDFAFNIHTEIGSKTRGIRVNQKLVPLSKELVSGDQVEVITSNAAKPKANWLEYVVSSKARSNIKSSLNDQKRTTAKYGEEILRRKLKHLKIKFNDKVSEHMLRFFKLKTDLDLFYLVGIDSIDNNRIRSFSSNYNNKFFNFFKKKLNYDSLKISKKKNNFNKLVFGNDNQSLLYKLSSCCNPIPGDPVFGFITLNDGIKVHKKGCQNGVSMQSKYAFRIINAKWITSVSDTFISNIKITGIDNIGLVSEVTRVISNIMNVDIYNINFIANDGIFEGNVGVKVNNKTMVNKVIKKIEKIKGIEKVTRE